MAKSRANQGITQHEVSKIHNLSGFDDQLPLLSFEFGFACVSSKVPHSSPERERVILLIGGNCTFLYTRQPLIVQ